VQHEPKLQLKTEAPSMISRLLSRFVVWLMRKDLRRLADAYPQTVQQLIDYHDRVSIMAINYNETGETNHRILSIATRSAYLLEQLERQRSDCEHLIRKQRQGLEICRKQRNEAKHTLQQIQHKLRTRT